ncbi:hypothetical protein ACINK0_03045 [Deinococcus sp. VB343]|uniref:Uncharacterized protein n=1 Tax=Deinococcus sp. VB142 TaxID=3112952 RepID=A0AAU6Q0Y4_9DEIO
MAAGRNYQRRGDPFTQKVRRGEGPPTVQSWRRLSTGREWFTRVPVSACYRLDAAQLGAAVREHAQRLAAAGVTFSAAQLARSLAFDWHAAAQSLTVRPRDTPKHLKAETRLSVTTSSAGPKGQGVRFWLICPRCSRRCGVLYASRWGRHGERLGEPLTGCRECLGLTDEARQRHKCPDWAGHVLAGPGDRRKPYKARAWGAARERALYVFQASAARALPGYFPKPSRPERWGLGPCPWGKAAGGRRAYERGSAEGVEHLGEPQPVPRVEHLGAV